MTQPGPWVEQWLSAPRFGAYLRLANSDRHLAFALYEWNAQLSAAYMRDLAHLEVALRNAYDRAITEHRPVDAPHWIFDADALFPPHLTTADDGTVIDSNAKTRDHLLAAITSAADAERRRINKAAREAHQPRPVHPIQPSPGHVVAELTFGFWRYLTKSAHEKRLWVPYLHHAFPPGTHRRAVDTLVTKLNDVRNRVAHHEPLDPDLATRRHNNLIELASWLSPELRDYIQATTSCPGHLTNRPN